MERLEEIARLERLKKSDDEVFKDHLFQYDNIKRLGQEMVDVVKNNEEVKMTIQKEIQESREVRSLLEWREEELDLRKQQELLDEKRREQEAYEESERRREMMFDEKSEQTIVVQSEPEQSEELQGDAVTK